MPDDQQLLARYLRDGSEAAFGEFVARYVNLVYSAALRRTGNDIHLAQDVAQLVFTDLARKARSLPRDVVLAGWLYRATRYSASQIMRGDLRRRLREQEAATMSAIESQTATDWESIRPMLDDALDKLNQTDRDALLLRFFEQRSLAEVGRALGANEDAARKRVSRALDKLRIILVREGLTTTAATLSVAISANAIQLAPAGLAATLTSASLAGAGSAAGITLTALKIMSMTKLQLAITGIVVAGATTALIVQRGSQANLRTENESLRQQVAQLRTDYQTLSNRVAPARKSATLSLPAPRMQSPVPSPGPETNSQSTDLIARLNRGEKAPALTAEQTESYLKEYRRSADSLLAAFRATGDAKLLKEATEKYPNDPQVAFTAAYVPDATPDERRHWLDVFKQSAANNSFADYLSAADHFKAGQTDQAIQDLSAAAGKQQFQDYSMNFILNGEEAYRSAGYPEADARVIPSMALLLPQFVEWKQLNAEMINLAAAYRQAGDESSAQAALQMDAALGQRMDGPENSSLLSQLVGMAIESSALRQMDPNAPYGDSGQTVKERLDEVNRNRSALTQFSQQLDSSYSTISAPDWITYHDRWRVFGEENAMRWLLNKYAQK